MSEIITNSADMSEHWRLITAEGQSDTHRVYGTWWVSETNVQTVDVTIWDKRGQYGRVYYSGDLTAFISDGEINLPQHMVRAEKRAEAEDGSGSSGDDGQQQIPCARVQLVDAHASVVEDIGNDRVHGQRVQLGRGGIRLPLTVLYRPAEPSRCTQEHGYECCGCLNHPEGKPWGWNYQAWEAHWDVCPNPERQPEPQRVQPSVEQVARILAHGGQPWGGR